MADLSEADVLLALAALRRFHQGTGRGGFRCYELAGTLHTRNRRFGTVEQIARRLTPILQGMVRAGSLQVSQPNGRPRSRKHYTEIQRT